MANPLINSGDAVLVVYLQKYNNNTKQQGLLATFYG